MKERIALAQSKNEGLEKEMENLRLEKRRIVAQSVPDVVGMGIRDAVYVLENRGLKVQVRGYGKVVKQSQLSGARVIKGSTILIQLRP